MRAECPARASLLREAATPEPIKQNPPRKAGLHIRRSRGNSVCGRIELPLTVADFSKPLCLPQAMCARASRFRAGCAATPEALLLSFVPVTLDLYRTVRRHLHWTLQNLVAFADRTGNCFPSVRTLAAATGQPRSTVSRHLAQLAEAGVIARQRRPGGVYAYVIAAASCRPARGVPPARKGCPTARKRRTGR